MKQQKRRGNKWCRKKRKTKPSVVDPTPPIVPSDVDPSPVNFTPYTPQPPYIPPYPPHSTPYHPYPSYYPTYYPYPPYPIPYPPYPTPHTPSYPTPTFNPHPFHVNPAYEHISRPIFSQPSDQPPIIYVNPNIFCHPVTEQGAKIKEI